MSLGAGDRTIGFSLAETEELLHLAEGGPDALRGGTGGGRGKLHDLEQRIADLERVRAALTEVVNRCWLPSDERLCSLLHVLR